MTAISIKVFDNAEVWLTKHLPDMNVDSVACVRRVSKFNPNGNTTYRDYEDDIAVERDMKAHVKALQTLCETVGVSLFVGGVKSPRDLLDAGNWDVEVVDAYFQLVMHGEVIYG